MPLKRLTRLPAQAALVILLIIGAACVPAQIPPQLAFTPGPAAVVQDRVVTLASGYRIPRPAGWDAQLSAADAPEALTLIAPDRQAIIIISAAANTPLPEVATIPTGSRVIVEETLDVSGTSLHLWLITLEDQRADRVTTLEELILTIPVSNAWTPPDAASNELN